MIQVGQGQQISSQGEGTTCLAGHRGKHQGQTGDRGARGKPGCSRRSRLRMGQSEWFQQALECKDCPELSVPGMGM